jgi:hypothetical protein
MPDEAAVIKIPKQYLQYNFGHFIDLITKYPIVTRKLLLIYSTELFFEDAAKDAKNKALSGGWTVFEYGGSNATKANIENSIQNDNPDFVLHFDHGNNYQLGGNGVVFDALPVNVTNVHLLSGRSISTVSCNSANGLGPAAINSNTRAYVGYSLHFKFLEDLVKSYFPVIWGKWIEATNAANKALLEGETYQTAEDIALKVYQEKIDELILMGELVVASNLTNNKNGLKRLGLKQAVARPIGILAKP